MPLSSRFTLNAVADLTSAAGSPDLATARVPLSKVYQSVLTSGVAAGQADVTWHDQRTIAPSANDDLDLAGVLAGLLGGTVTFAKIKGLIVFAAAANANNVVISGAASNGWTAFLNATGTAQVRPGMCVAAFVGEGDLAALAVAAGTNDILRISNGGAGTSVTYDIILVGTSA